jgi:hypothetical protein
MDAFPVEFTHLMIGWESEGIMHPDLAGKDNSVNTSSCQMVIGEDSKWIQPDVA